jgi:maleate isomerase
MTGHNPSMARANIVRRPIEREYGRAGFFGMVSPQANPTVEPEMHVLLPAGAAMLTARAVSSAATLHQRLLDYLTDLDRTLDSFGDLAFDAVGFACTGSSYLIDRAEERRLLAAIEDSRGYPVISAAAAVRAAIRWLGIGDVVLVSPYPEWLTDASRAHWEREGVNVQRVVQIAAGGDAHGIYSLTTPSVVEAAESLARSDMQAVLLAGTGMPTLRAIQALEPLFDRPVLSSNLCLAWALAEAVGASSAGPESRLYGGWSERLCLA